MVNYNLIIEGVDRIGKSTLVKALSEKHLAIKLTAPTSIENTYYKYLTFFLRLNGSIPVAKPYIYDRGHISEIVYGPLYRPNNYRSTNLLIWLRKWEKHTVANAELYPDFRPTVIVYLYPTNKDLMLKDERPNANLRVELDRYRIALTNSSMPVMKLCTQTQTDWRTTENIIDELNCKLGAL